MFPGVNGFHWDAGHILFLGAFFAVAIVVAAVFGLALLRAANDRMPQREQAIRWHREFRELLSDDRRCRHELTGEIRQRQCPNEFDCRYCEDHPKFRRVVPTMSESDATASNGTAPTDRYYHRGHTWAKLESDGTYTVGLDELGEKLIGPEDVLEMPEPGAMLFVNGTAWRVRNGRDSFTVLSPIEGEVVETDRDRHSWRLRVRPQTGFRTDHLLRGPEVSAWLANEEKRLHRLAPEDARARMFLNA